MTSTTAASFLGWGRLQPAAWRLVILSLVAATAAFPQHLSFGLKAGHPFEDVFSNRVSAASVYTPASGRYTIGPVVELHLPFRVSVELDLLYRPVKYNIKGINSGTLSDLTAGEWRIPVLAKYQLRPGLVSPFLAGGVCWQRFSGVKNTADQVQSSTSGGVVAGGLEGKLTLIRLSGEIRYTRWGAATFSNVVSGIRQSNLNQMELLVGISF